MRHGVHKTRGFNLLTWNTGDVGTAGKTFNNRPTLTGRTGAFKDRVTRELRRHTWNQINNQHEGKTRSQGAQSLTPPQAIKDLDEFVSSSQPIFI